MKLKIIWILTIFGIFNINAQQKLIPSVTSSFASTKVFNDAVCDNHLNLFSNALSNNEDWAVKLMDTWAKISAGYLSGNTMNLGDFDHCVRFRYDTISSGKIQGQHCWVPLSALPNSTLETDNTDLNLRKL